MRKNGFAGNLYGACCFLSWPFRVSIQCWACSSMALCEPTCTPVSYTHLDVYKRQSVDKVVETMDKMSPEELQAIKDKLARMERENAEDAEVKDAE